MSTWIKPNGMKLEVTDNQATIEYVTSLNWKPEKEAATNDNSTSNDKRGNRKARRKNS